MSSYSIGDKPCKHFTGYEFGCKDCWEGLTQRNEQLIQDKNSTVILCQGFEKEMKFYKSAWEGVAQELLEARRQLEKRN